MKSKDLNDLRIDFENKLVSYIENFTGQKHLKQNCMDYIEHCTFSLSLSYYFLSVL